MMKPLKHMHAALVAVFILTSSFAGGAEQSPASDLVLPPTTNVFVVAFEPQPAGMLAYFEERSFMALYPSLRPAKVKIAVGARRVWQRGAIVTKDKKVLFWSTCANTFIAVETASGQRFYAREGELFVQ
jgi:hypothetical protein